MLVEGSLDRFAGEILVTVSLAMVKCRIHLSTCPPCPCTSSPPTANMLLAFHKRPFSGGHPDSLILTPLFSRTKGRDNKQNSRAALSTHVSARQQEADLSCIWLVDDASAVSVGR